jgi:flagellar rod assembly protein/muramidase FlgJ
MPPSAFIAMLVKSAQDCQRATGIPASFTIAQAALETGWGTRVIGCNLFGIKADRAWKGKTVSFATTEHLGGKNVGLVDKFRAYPSWDECMADRAEFFRRNKRYADCFKESTGDGWARAVAKAGYATDPNYAKILTDIMRGRNLYKLDVPAKVAA